MPHARSLASTGPAEPTRSRFPARRTDASTCSATDCAPASPARTRRRSSASASWSPGTGSGRRWSGGEPRTSTTSAGPSGSGWARARAASASTGRPASCTPSSGSTTAPRIRLCSRSCRNAGRESTRSSTATRSDRRGWTTGSSRACWECSTCPHDARHGRDRRRPRRTHGGAPARRRGTAGARDRQRRRLDASRSPDDRRPRLRRRPSREPASRAPAVRGRPSRPSVRASLARGHRGRGRVVQGSVADPRLPGRARRELPAPDRGGGRQALGGMLGLARRFVQPAFRDAVLSALKGRLALDERVGFPAVLGIQKAGEVWRDLEKRLLRTVFEVPTLPPSVPGIRLFEAMTAALRLAGGRILIGPVVVGAETKGRRVDGIAAQASARPTTHRARAFVLASGGIAGGGIRVDSHGKVREGVFDLALAGVPAANGRPRFLPGYFEEQPLDRVGVPVDERLRPTDPDGRPRFENLHAAGAMLAGAVPWREASGNGLSLATGYAAAEAILQGENA